MATLKEKFDMKIKDLWENHKVFLIVFGVLIVVIKFRGILIDMLISGGKKDMKETRAKDTALAVEENQAKADADQTKKDADIAASNKPAVDENWYKK